MKNRKERANRGKVNAAKTSQGQVLSETKHPTAFQTEREADVFIDGMARFGVTDCRKEHTATGIFVIWRARKH